MVELSWAVSCNSFAQIFESLSWIEVEGTFWRSRLVIERWRRPRRTDLSPNLISTGNVFPTSPWNCSKLLSMSCFSQQYDQVFFCSCLFVRPQLFQTFQCDSAFLLIEHSLQTRTNSTFVETKEFKQRLKKTKVLKLFPDSNILLSINFHVFCWHWSDFTWNLKKK